MTETDACLQWYNLNAICERSGHVWMRDPNSRWDSEPPLIVTAKDSGDVRHVSGRYGRLERRAAWCLGQLADRKIPRVMGYVAGLTIDLGPSQVAAIDRSLTYPASVIVGGPGTGKTTIAKVLANAHKRVLGLSPTGKGADRLSESLGAECYTIHRAVWSACGDADDKVDFDDYDLIIVDETGMLDTETAEMLFRSIHKTGARIVLMGDSGQLPSVGPGKVLAELMICLPTSRLDLVYRYSDIDIGLACDEAREGRIHHKQTARYRSIEGDILAAQTAYSVLSSEFGRDETRVITYHTEDAHAFNRLIMKGRCDRTWPVMCLKNNYRFGIFNGQCGHKSGNSLIFGERRVSTKAIQWSYSQASTCHRAQGGQWRAVIVWVNSARWITGEWFLTACSRAMDKLIVICTDADRTERCLFASKPSSKRVSLFGEFARGIAQWES